MYEPKPGDLVAWTHADAGYVFRVASIDGAVVLRGAGGGAETERDWRARAAEIVPLRPTAPGQRVRCADGRVGRTEEWDPRCGVEGTWLVGPDAGYGLRQWEDARECVRVADAPERALGSQPASAPLLSTADITAAVSTAVAAGSAPVSSGTAMSIMSDASMAGAGGYERVAENLVGYAAWVDPDFEAKLAKKIADVSKACDTAAQDMGAAAYEWSAQYLGKPVSWKPPAEAAPEPARVDVPFTVTNLPRHPTPRYVPALGERVHCAATNETGRVVSKSFVDGRMYASVLLDGGETRTFGVSALAPADVPCDVVYKPAELAPSEASPVAARHAGRCPTCHRSTREPGTVRLHHWLCGCPVEVEGSEHEALIDGEPRNVLVWGGGTFGDGWTREEALADWREDLALVQGDPTLRRHDADGYAWPRGKWRREIEQRRDWQKAARERFEAIAKAKNDARGPWTPRDLRAGLCTAEELRESEAEYRRLDAVYQAHERDLCRTPGLDDPSPLGRALTSSTPNGDGTHSCVVNIYTTGSDATGLGKVRS